MGFSIFKESGKKTKRKSTSCKYNDGVVCPEKDRCKKCGWNPKVADRRLEAFFERLPEENPALYEKLMGEV